MFHCYVSLPECMGGSLLVRVCWVQFEGEVLRSKCYFWLWGISVFLFFYFFLVKKTRVLFFPGRAAGDGDHMLWSMNLPTLSLEDTPDFPPQNPQRNSQTVKGPGIFWGYVGEILESPPDRGLCSCAQPVIPCLNLIYISSSPYHSIAPVSAANNCNRIDLTPAHIYVYIIYI